MVFVGTPYAQNPQILVTDGIGGSPYGPGTLAGTDGSRQPVESCRCRSRHSWSPAVHQGEDIMNAPTIPQPTKPATLKDVVDRLIANPDLAETRRRDLRSAVVIYGKLKGEPLSAIPLDLAAIRRTLDGIRAGAGKGISQAMGKPA
jgi:hypothetical protein